MKTQNNILSTMSKFILSILLFLISSLVLAQDNTINLNFPINSVVYDSVNMDCLKNDSTFNFKITSNISKKYNLQFTVARGRRVVTVIGKTIETVENVPTYFSVILTRCAWGDVILVEEKENSQYRYWIKTYRSYWNELYDNRKGYQYPTTLTFENRLYENTSQIEWKESFVEHTREVSDSTFDYCNFDSLYTKKLNDSSYFISSKVEKIKYYLSQDIHTYWREQDDDYKNNLSLSLSNKNDSLFFDEFYNQNVLVVRGRIQKDTLKNLRKNYRKEIKSNPINSNLYKQKPYLILLDFKNLKRQNKINNWIYYSIVRTKRGLLVIYKMDNSFVDNFHYYRFY